MRRGSAYCGEHFPQGLKESSVFFGENAAGIKEYCVAIEAAHDRRSEGFRALRKGLGYCWSVAVAAHPAAGKPALERWLAGDDPDVRWIVRQNLKKARLARLDAGWVARCLAEMG